MAVKRSDRLAGLRIPQADGFVPRAGTESSAIWRRGNIVSRVGVSPEFLQHLSIPVHPRARNELFYLQTRTRHLLFGDQATPETLSSCFSRIRGCRPAVTSHRYTLLLLAMPRLLPPPIGKPRSIIWRPSHADDTLLVLMPLQESPTFHVPEPNGLVIRGRCQDAAVGRQRHPIDPSVCPRSVWRSFRAGWAVCRTRGRLLRDAFSIGAILFSPAFSMQSAIYDTDPPNLLSGRIICQGVTCPGGPFPRSPRG